MRLKYFLAAVCSVVLLQQAQAQQSWPNRQITLIVPFGSGSLADIIGRNYATKLQKYTGINPWVLCHSGMGGSLGWADLDKDLAVGICHNRMFLRSHFPYTPIREALIDIYDIL